MRVPKAYAYPVYGVFFIIIGILTMTGNFISGGNDELICGTPILIVGIILLIRGIYYIKRGRYQ